MTTNFTHIINENIDMFDDEFLGLVKVDEYELGNGVVLVNYPDEDEWMPSEEDYRLLRESEARLVEIIERCGEYGADEFAEEWGWYSDLYKDINGFRPHWFR